MNLRLLFDNGNNNDQGIEHNLFLSGNNNNELLSMGNMPNNNNGGGSTGEAMDARFRRNRLHLPNNRHKRFQNGDQGIVRLEAMVLGVYLEI